MMEEKNMTETVEIPSQAAILKTVDAIQRQKNGNKSGWCYRFQGWAELIFSLSVWQAKLFAHKRIYAVQQNKKHPLEIPSITPQQAQEKAELEQELGMIILNLLLCAESEKLNIISAINKIHVNAVQTCLENAVTKK